MLPTTFVLGVRPAKGKPWHYFYTVTAVPVGRLPSVSFG